MAWVRNKDYSVKTKLKYICFTVPSNSKDSSVALDEKPGDKNKDSDESDGDSDDEDPKNVVFEYNNPCFLMSTYKDPVEKIKKLQIVATMFSGASKVIFGVDPSGMSCYFSYQWPKLLYNPETLFDAEITVGAITNYHPKVLALEKAASELKQNIEDVPRGKLTLKLPFRVQTDTRTQSKKVIKTGDGSYAVYIELKAYQDLFDIKSSDMEIII